MKIKKAFSRIISTATLAGLLGITGCENGTDATSQSKRVEYNLPYHTDKPCEFAKFGYVPWSYERSYSSVGVAVGDMDGDGDLDIVAVDGGGRITIYENKIPQRK